MFLDGEYLEQHVSDAMRVSFDVQSLKAPRLRPASPPRRGLPPPEGENSQELPVMTDNAVIENLSAADANIRLPRIPSPATGNGNVHVANLSARRGVHIR